MNSLRPLAICLALVTLPHFQRSSHAVDPPPVQVLNFDFGEGAAYVGDNGVLSNPGGTLWNKIPAAVANTDFSIGPGMEIYDEFGQPSKALIYSLDALQGDPGQAMWLDGATPGDGPLSTGIHSSGPGTTTLTIGRVNEFQEMVIYFSTIGDGAEGGFTGNQFDNVVIEPFDLIGPIDTTGFPGAEGFSFLRFTNSPPIGSGLGEAPTITIAITNPQTTIAALQIRGRFRGLPEPATAALLVMGSAIVISRRGCRHSRPL